MVRLPIAAILVALSACDDLGAERLFTAEETAALEKRVLDKVAETDQSCIRPALVELMKPDCPCDNEAIRQKDPVFAKYCADKLAVEINAVAAAGVGCSPFQVGVAFKSFVSPVHAMWPARMATLLSQRALAADDPAQALDEILDAVRVSQDATRGRVPLVRAVITATMEDKLLATALQLVTKRPLSEDQLTALIEKVDALIETEPRIAENLRGEALYDALHLGVVAIKGPFWTPPGGRSTEFGAQVYAVDNQEDVGASIISGELWLEDELMQFCSDDNISVCFVAMRALSTQSSVDVAAEVQGAGTLLALDASEEVRLHLQRSVITMTRGFLGGFEVGIGQRAHVLSRLAALRIQLDVLRTRRCPVLEANAMGTYNVRGIALPRQLGGLVQVQRVDGGIDVLPPVWFYRRQLAAHISCP